MRLISETVHDLQSLYVSELRLLLSAEQQIVDGLKRMIETASDPELFRSLQAHLAETETHVSRLEGILQHSTSDPSPRKCRGVAALIDEAEDAVGEVSDRLLKDIALIGCAQKIEHFEIAAYGTARAAALALGMQGDADILDMTIHEEGNADHLLTEIAERLTPEAARTPAR